jgi:hypothetical protein
LGAENEEIRAIFHRECVGRSHPRLPDRIRNSTRPKRLVDVETSGVYQPCRGSLKMEILLALFALAVAAYYFFRNRTKWGLETVRSQVFLSGLLSGHTVSDANYAASFGFMEQLPAEIIQCATALSKAEYGGRTFPVIAEAYQKGMKRRLPIWQKIIILGSIRSPQKDVPSQAKPGAKPHPHALNLYKFPT